jgi:hypothetical protein
MTNDINDKIFCVISDNASHMVKTFSFPVPGYSDSDEQFWLYNDTIEDYCDLEESESENPFPKHKRCYAHSLQLVIKDAFEECGQTIQKVIAKISKVVSHVRKSVFSSEVLEDENRLQACNATRWNSQMHMIRSMVNIPDEKFEKLECASITAYDKKVLCEICKINKPFEDATLLVQREKNVSGSMVIPVTLGLKKHLQAVKCDYSTKCVSALLASLSKRLCKYEEDDAYTTSSILDTRFKLLWSKPEDVDDLTTDLKKTFSFIESFKSEDDEADSISLPAKKVKTDDFFSVLPRGTPKRKRHMSGSTQCIDTYIGEECDTSDANPLLYWKENEKQFPILAKLATKYLSVPASSAPVER